MKQLVFQNIFLSIHDRSIDEDEKNFNKKFYRMADCRIYIYNHLIRPKSLTKEQIDQIIDSVLDSERAQSHHFNQDG